MDWEEQFEAGFEYEIQTEGMRQGAEARVYICTYLGRPAIMKERWALAETLELGKAIGEAVGRMHFSNLIHGDLTTSNVILKHGDFKRPYFIDFGLCALGKISPEDKGVDLYVLERAMISTHVNSEEMFKSVLEGYKSINQKQGIAVLKKLDEIRLRGRKRDMTG
ncbi:Kae1-associated kinase Bud32 [Teladorsagia circumcincta]|uniref:non-specific serine/threonine protein kinase n=1 Tax=Teladorsagia circumcincta TaxID=45464 RepID=A0A2G9TSS9_TELCI|nr:Kae1-associated kinase Bud32 [Teladorsagia circumcincta]